MVFVLKCDYMVSFVFLKSTYYVIKYDIEHAPLTFNKLKVRIWNLLQFSNA